MNLQAIILEDERHNILNNNFYMCDKPSDVTSTVSYLGIRNLYIEDGQNMGLDCSDFAFNQYQERFGVNRK